MEYVSASGKTLTDKNFDDMAKEYETGDWDGKLSICKPPAKPAPICDDYPVE